MFRVQPEIGVFEGHITGEDVVIFVPGDGGAVGQECQL
jgi:hypothetical protein